MTPAEIAEVRRNTGLTQAQLAAALRLGSSGGRTVRRWESGDTKLPGPVSIIYELLRHGTASIEGTALRLVVLEEGST